MNIRQRLEAFWAGERPDQIPYTIYEFLWRHVQDDPDWQPLFERGLGVTWFVPTYEVEYHQVEVIEMAYVENGKRMLRRVQRTPVGEIEAIWTDGWHHSYYLESAEDYKVMTHIIELSEVKPAYGTYLAREREFPTHYIAIPTVRRTPLQTILVDLAGLANLGFHLYECRAEVNALYEALLEQFRRIVAVVAEGPGNYVSNMENFTCDALGPGRYEEYLLPVYEECFPLLRQAGKIVGSHYDGSTSHCREQIARAPIDLIESLTPPPEGDQTLAEARQVWPDKLFWSNINVGLYDLPRDDLKRAVVQLVREAAPDGRGLAFEISEALPRNWRESVMIVLDALGEIGCDAVPSR